MLDADTLRETPWHARAADEAVASLETDAERGLSADAAQERLRRYGRNRIRTVERTPWWRILLHQVADPLIYILLAAAAVSLLVQAYTDAAVILAVVVLNGAIGFAQEWRARKAIRALAEMGAPDATVVREGGEREVDAEEVVPGDIIVLGSGDRVPADARLLVAEDLRADESALTGEAEPVSKREEPVEDEHAVPGDRYAMVFAGTNVTRGRGRGVVVGTGDASELGRIAVASQEVAGVEAPIQERVRSLARWIAAVVLVLTALVVTAAVLVDVPLADAVRTAVALAVAAVPEGLPIVLTVTLAVGVQRMARRNAIIRALPAVETLGSTTVVGADKTGTLTANRMTTRVIWTGCRRYEVTGTGWATEGEIRPSEPERAQRRGERAADGAAPAVDEAVRLTLLAGLLANEARGIPREEEGAEAAGDPTELALLVAAAKAGLEPDATRAEHRRLDIIPFESERQLMATLNESPEERRVYAKGSPEAVLDRCERMTDPDGRPRALDRDAARRTADGLADEGYRVLAMAFRTAERERFEDDDPGGGFVFAGFQAMEDPVRPEAPAAVEAAERAGIRVIMLTGDHARTARAVGRRLGLGGDDEVRALEGRELDDLSDEELDRRIREVDVYARVSPEHKLKLVEGLKAQGEIVAVTGDGVNDAPALQTAHLGVAMGRAGTDVAREASDMVLADDNFASITNAVEEGRVVFSNIRKVTYFLLSTGVGEVLAILASLVGPWPLIFLPTQVLWINLVTNGVQDVALAVEKGEPGLLDEPPRDPGEGVLNRPVLYRLAWIGLFVAVVTTAVFWWMLRPDVPLELARSVAMTQIVIIQFFHVLNVRSWDRSVLRVPLRDNPFLAVGLPLALLAHIGVLYVPFLRAIFDTAPLSLRHWAFVVLVGLSIIVLVEVDKALVRRRRRPRARRTT